MTPEAAPEAAAGFRRATQNPGPVRALLLRHGQTADNLAGLVQGQGGAGLSGPGREQAAAAGVRLRREAIAAIYASDLARTRETATIVAAALAAGPVCCDPRLREQDFGEYEGRPVRQLLRAMVGAGADFTSFDPAGGERAELFRARVAGFYAELAARHPGQTVLLVTHHGFIRMTQRLHRELVRPPATPVPVDNGSLTLAEIGRAGVLSISEYRPGREEGSGDES